MDYDLDNDDTRDLLDGLYAWDKGCTDSGIKDDVRRDELRKYLKDLGKFVYPGDDCRLVAKKLDVKLCRFIREYVISKERVEQGYGVEDMLDIIDWISSFAGLGITP